MCIEMGLRYNFYHWLASIKLQSDPGGGGGTPLYKPYRYVPPQRVGFLRRFGLKKLSRFCPFWSGIGYGLRRNYGCVSMCSSFQFQMNEKESVICEFEMDFKTDWRYNFCVMLTCNVVFCDHRWVWKRVWILEARSEKGCGKWHFLIWNRVRIWRTGRHTPPIITKSTPPGSRLR